MHKLWRTFLLAAFCAFSSGCHHATTAQFGPVHSAGKALQPGEAALIAESDYIVACSCTTDAPHHALVAPGSDAYGAINDVRVLDTASNPPDPASPRTTQPGPSWVRPGEAAMAVIGLMAAAKHLHVEGDNVARYEDVLHSYFQTWLLTNQQPFDANASDADRGGVVDQVEYTASGSRVGHSDCGSGTTAQTLCAMWKYGEYLRDTGRAEAAEAWLRAAWPLASSSGNFLQRCFNARYQMVQPNTSHRDLWTGDSALSCAALWCLARWATTLHQPPGAAAGYGAMASALTAGLEQMKDAGGWHDFYRLRDSAHGFAPGYGNCIDQLCFAPYEADAIDPGESYARRVSDWWSAMMTASVQTPNDWKSYGTHWHDYFASQTANAPFLAQNSRLYPGPGLQLAKVEWKHAQRTGDPITRQRFAARYNWAASPQRSDLWFGADGRQEAHIPNGLVDWRDADQPGSRAAPSERFVDTSAYFLEATLMRYWNIDTKYVPE